jgi:hypothetical protein
MPSYKIIAPIKTGGRVRRDGVIEMDARTAAQLVASGFLVPNTHGESANGSGGDAAGAQAPAAEPAAPAAKAEAGSAQSPIAGAAAELAVSADARVSRRRK